MKLDEMIHEMNVLAVKIDKAESQGNHTDVCEDEIRLSGMIEKLLHKKYIVMYSDIEKRYIVMK